MPATTRPRPRRLLLNRSLRAAGIALLVLVLLELGLRGIGMIVAADGGGTGPAAAGNERVILCLGDSWTHGLGAGSYGEVLEELLDARASESGGPRYRVVRSGVPGSNSSQGLYRLAEHLSEQRYDTVILFVGNNDHQNLAGSEYWKYAASPGPLSSLTARGRAFVHSLRVFKLSRTAWLAATGRPTLDRYFERDPGGNVQVAKDTVIELGAHRRQLEHNLSRMVELVREHGARPVLMTYFYFHGFEVNESILDVAAIYGVPVVNNTMAFHDRIPEEKRGEYYELAHPTHLGHRFIAENILETVPFE